MAINSKEEICNMTLGHLGNYGTVANIDIPSNDKEIIFSQWFDISRQTLLSYLMPNFAISRKKVAALASVPAAYVGIYGYAYAYPSDCLKVLGIGNISDKDDYDYIIEENIIYTNDAWTSGLPLRYIKDIEDVSKWSSSFKMLFSWFLAGKVVMPITQDINKKKLIESLMPQELSGVSALNAQENKPVRKSTSRFRQSRNIFLSRNREKL